MYYHIYNDEGIILRERPLKESDLSLKILTKNLGLIKAVATGLRKGNSKRRPPLTELSLTKVSLVRGKKDWRVTTATLEQNIFSKLRTQKKTLKAYARGLRLIESLVQGEEKNPDLYEIAKDAGLFAVENNLEEISEIFESLFVAKVLACLGYLRKEEFPKEIFNKKLDMDDFDIAKPIYKDLIKAINKGIIESGLS